MKTVTPAGCKVIGALRSNRNLAKAPRPTQSHQQPQAGERQPAATYLDHNTRLGHEALRHGLGVVCGVGLLAERGPEMESTDKPGEGSAAGPSQAINEPAS